MFTLNDLQRMSQTNEVNKDDLVNIEEVQINQTFPAIQRMENYLSQIKNPYHFLCGNSVVHLRFEDEAKNKIMEEYLSDTSLEIPQEIATGDMFLDEHKALDLLV